MSAADFELVRQGLEWSSLSEPQADRTFRALDRIEAERAELIAALENAPCFGCGVRFGDPRAPRVCVSCRPTRDLLARAKGDPA